MARPIDRKELKNPDQFLTFWHRVGAAVAAQRRAVLAGLVTLVVVVIGVWAVSAFTAKNATKASEDFAQIDRIATAELLPATGDAPKYNDGIPRFKTEKERIEAALKQADTFIANHGGSKLKDEAQLIKARYLLMLGRTDEAAGLYQQLAGDSKLADNVRFLAEEGVAYAHEAKGEVDKAAAAFGALADKAQDRGGFYRDRSLFNKARLLEKANKQKEAEAIFRSILDKSPSTTLRDEINDRLAAYEGK